MGAIRFDEDIEIRKSGSMPFAGHHLLHNSRRVDPIVDRQDLLYEDQDRVANASWGSRALA